MASRFGKFLKRTAKKVGQTAIKVVKYAAPVAGGLLLGPAGAVGGTALGALAGQHRAKNKGKALKRSLIYGAATGAVGVGVSALLASSAAQTASSIGQGGSVAPEASVTGFESYGDGSELARLGGFAGRQFDKYQQGGFDALPGAGGADVNSEKNLLEQLTGGGGGGGFFSGSATGETAEAGPFGIPVPVLLIGGVVALVAFSGGGGKGK